MIIVAGAEAWIAIAEGILERLVQHGGTNIEKGLHGRPVSAHLLFLVHALERARKLDADIIEGPLVKSRAKASRNLVAGS